MNCCRLVGAFLCARVHTPKIVWLSLQRIHESHRRYRRQSRTSWRRASAALEQALALLACFQGFRTRGGADSVVQSIFLVIVADALFSIAFSVLDL